MKYNKLAGLVFTTIIFLSLSSYLSSFAVAQNGNGNGYGRERNIGDDNNIDDEFEQENERWLKVEFSEYSAKIVSELTNGDTHNEFTFKINLEDAMIIKVEYNSDNTTEEYESEMKIVFDKIIEYIDVNEDGMYNSGDAYCQTYFINEFKHIARTTATLEDESKLENITLQTIDEVFTLHIYMSSDFMNIGDTLITPTKMKIDIIINNFPYNYENSQLALKVKLVSEVESEYRNEDETEEEERGYTNGMNEEGLSKEEGNSTIAFTWLTTAIIDGVETQIRTNPIHPDEDNANDNKVYFNYPRGTLIYHDPRLGLDDMLSAEPMDWIIWIVAGLAIVAVISIIYLLYKQITCSNPLNKDKKICIGYKK